MTVFISIAGIVGVTSTRKYQADAYTNFMNDKEMPTSKEFCHGDIVFKIVKFDNSGLVGKYPSFCSLVNEKGQQHTLSNDKKELEAFHGFRSRLTML
jgi:hypothetical protein